MGYTSSSYSLSDEDMKEAFVAHFQTLGNGSLIGYHTLIRATAHDVIKKNSIPPMCYYEVENIMSEYLKADRALGTASFFLHGVFYGHSGISVKHPHDVFAASIAKAPGYNVWNVDKQRWSRLGRDGLIQSVDNPPSLTLKEANRLHEWLRFNVRNYTFEVRPLTSKVVKPKSVGCTCRKCLTFNEYAESNQTDGTYICYSCR